jgi:hypothetical protein
VSATVPVLASLWDPTILGILTVLSGVVLFMGSTYLLLSTNVGARLGFQIAAAAFTGIMVLLSALWLTTSTPLNSPKGRVPLWKTVSCPKATPTCALVPSLSDSPINQLARIANDPKMKPIDEDSYQTLRPAVDASLVQATPVPGVTTPTQPYAKYQYSAQVLTQAPVDDQGIPNKNGKETLREYIVGGNAPYLVKHDAKYAAVELCQELPEPSDTFYPGGVNPNIKPTQPGCDPKVPHQWLILVYDYGSIRLPPLMYLLTFLSLFGVTLYAMHTSEMNQRRAAKAAVATA